MLEISEANLFFVSSSKIIDGMHNAEALINLFRLGFTDSKSLRMFTPTSVMNSKTSERYSST